MLPPDCNVTTDAQAMPIPAAWAAGTRYRRPDFTPFIGTLGAQLERAVRQVFALPDSVPLRAHADVAPTPVARLTIGPSDKHLELAVFMGPRDAWFSSDQFSVVLRSPATDDTSLLTMLHRRLRAVERAGAEGPWPALRAALEDAARYDGVRDSMFREVSDTEALVRLGFRCNQKCEFCWQSRDWPDPPDALYGTWVDEIAAAGIDTITFSGGEPTIHRSLPALIERARDHGMDVVLQTNAIQLAKPGFAQRLRDAGVVRLFVSFHSHVPEVSDAMTSAPHSHMRTRQGIAEALAAGIAVQLNAVVERRNYAHLGDHARFIVEHYVRPFPDNPLLGVEYSHPCQYFNDELWPEASAPLDAVKPHLLDAMRVLYAANVPVGGIGTCGFPPCLLKGSDLPLRAMERERQNERDVSGRLYVEECASCVLREDCLGLRREYIDLHGGRGIEPFDTPPLNLVT